jgi:hypothetical protein
MESAKGKPFNLNIKNTSDTILFIGLEPLGYCESLQPNDELKLSVTTPSLNDLTNFFWLEYSQNQITVFIEHDWKKFGEFEIRIEINGKEDITFTL